MSRKGKGRRRQPRALLLLRANIATTRIAVSKYKVGDPIRARLFINTGEQGNPEIVAQPGDPGVVVGVKDPGALDYGLLAVRFGESVVDLMPKEIEPDWEEG